MEQVIYPLRFRNPQTFENTTEFVGRKNKKTISFGYRKLKPVTCSATTH